MVETGSNEQKKLFSASLFSKFLALLDNSINNKSKLKFVVYSAYDTTVFLIILICQLILLIFINYLNFIICIKFYFLY